MTFARIRPMGTWTGTILTAELEAFDDRLSKALDGDAGGTYAPSAQLVLGGSGLKVTGPFETTGGATMDSIGVSGNVTVGGDLLVIDDVTIQDDLTVQGDASLQGNVDVFGDLDVTGSIECTDAAFHGVVLTDADWTHSGDVTWLGAGAVHTITDLVLHGNLVSDAAIAQSGILTFSGGGHARVRHINATDTNSNYGVSTTDVLQIKSGTVTAVRTFSTNDTGAALGDEMEWINWTTFDHVLKNSSGGDFTGSLIVPKIGATSFLPGVVRFRFADNGGGSAQWRVVQVIAPT